MRTALVAFQLAVAVVSTAAHSSADDALRMYGGADGMTEVHRLKGHHGDVVDAVWLPDGSLLTAGVDGTLRLWDVAAGRELDVVAQQSQPITKLLLGLDFNAHQTKGVYVGKDQSVAESHSLVGTPKTGFKPADEKFDWMMRAHLAGSGER